MEKICVAVRVRPPVAVSQETSNGNHWRIEDNHISLRKSDGTPISGVSHSFDHVFDESCTNARVYELLTKDIIHAAVGGFNGTAFAYGQTSSGKTFTMNGSEANPGIIHRAVKDVFNKIQMISDREFLIRVSYMEIYNEEINDLFAVENQKLQIHESLERGIFVAGLREEIVSNAEQVLNLIAAGEVNRHFGETNMNVRSSRSHTIFRMVIESKAKDTVSSTDYSCSDTIRVSVLNLVDLAGSERIAKTGADGVRLKEGKHINKSLMALGNVINKLSDGAKQRGHIPYRDSKLTRILQPALGGNAKTSIICTIAPEEVHIEETKGTLQFASRAKRITNCAQVNEILTDAALLKRQKLEIEELRRKLQGSRAEVLEQEILKLRNEMLKYELEREKLETQLEEERKSHKERDQCIREQQMKIDNLSSLVTIPECDKNDGQKSWRHSSKEEFNDSNNRSQGDAFRTPCFKAAPNAFVAKRSDYSRLADYSPLPDTLSNIADEDTWLKMNKGYIADLDSIQKTPARKVQSFPSSETTSGFSNDNYRLEVENLRRQLELITEEKNELEKKHSEQLLLNNHLMEEMSELKQEVEVIREIPQYLCKSVASCKDLYEDILLTLQSVVPDGESSTAKLLSTTNEIGISLFSNLESYFLMTKDDHEPFPGNGSLVQEQCRLLSERLKGTISSLAELKKSAIQNKEAKNKICSCDYKGSNTGGETASSMEKPSYELDNIKKKYHDLEKKLDLNNQLLEDSREKYASLERDFQLLKEERDSLLERVSESSQKLAFVTEQKENILKDLNTEAQRRKDLVEEIKQFNVAFAGRQRSFTSFQSEFKSKMEKLRALDPVSVSKPLGY
ncbi:kinesin-like protein KIN-7N isoform X2 [Jatropha curcas]|uniref:kinesin-like protein KIN-7N isoform X2 n=1 Tax=Jatropha curcas TaxID=180498 RepID=UPI0009D7393F|nr:kinesin-like protein KIN-7N isoform X2 [Jatropha curcas]